MLGLPGTQGWVVIEHQVFGCSGHFRRGLMIRLYRLLDLKPLQLILRPVLPVFAFVSVSFGLPLAQWSDLRAMGLLLLRLPSLWLAPWLGMSQTNRLSWRILVWL